MGNLLFSSKGRIGPAAFHKGAVILLAVNFFGWLAWFGGLTVGVIVGALSFVLIYCWACLFAKRLHDAGKSALPYLPIFITFIAGVWLLSNVFLALFSPEIVELNKEYLQTVAEKPETMDDIMSLFKLLEKMYQKTAIPLAISFLVCGAILAFTVNAKLKSDPNDNQYGPAT